MAANGPVSSTVSEVLDRAVGAGPAVPVLGLPHGGAGSAARGSATAPSRNPVAPDSGLELGGEATPRPRPVHVVMMASKGLEPDPSVTDDHVRRAVGQASAWWESQSAGWVRFEVAQVLPWQRTSVSCTDVEAIWAQAREWAPASMNAGHHLLVVLPGTAVDDGCEYGFGSTGVPASGGSVMVTELVPSLIAHELGHNLGLGHSHALTCEGAADGIWDPTSETWPTGCVEQPYDDLLSVMGYSGPGFGETALNAVHVDALGVDPDAVHVIPSGGSGAHMPVTVRVPPLASGRPGRVVKVTEPNGPTYYVEYRTAIGLDANYAASGWLPQLGVRILRTDPRFRDATGSYELDASPKEGPQYHRALTPGGWFVSAGGGVRIRTIATAADEATIEVSVGPGDR